MVAGPADASRERILDAALDLGEQRGWDELHLHDLARALGLTLDDIAVHFADKDALAEAWFDRADAVMRTAPQSSGWSGLTPRHRLQQALRAWLWALEPHRRLTGAMLRYKLQPEHLHLQALGAMRVSRTVQWWREAAELSSTGWQRELQEVALTGIFLATVARWLNDGSPGARRSLAFLDWALAVAERGALWLPAGR